MVADSWPDSDPSPRVITTTSTPSTSEPNSSTTTSTTPHTGGHFERRISFGYDADLVGVRAEFDGDMLRIVVPRRQGFSSGAFF